MKEKTRKEPGHAYCTLSCALVLRPAYTFRASRSGRASARASKVVASRRDDIRLKKEFREQHPNYRRYTVDTTPHLFVIGLSY